MQRHWVIVLLPRMSSTSVKPGYHVDSERKSGSKPEGCHVEERAESEQPAQAPKKLMGAVSSCGHVDQPEERFASWIGHQDRPSPVPRMGRTGAARELEERKLAELILKGQGGLRQTSVAILSINTDVTDKLKWEDVQGSTTVADPRSSSFAMIVTARNELVQKCLCLEVRHESQNVEQALRRMTQRNSLNISGGMSRRSQSRVDTMHAKLSTLCSCWDSVLQVASCQQLTSQHQLPVVSFCCRATPQTCQMCLNCWSRTAKNSVEHYSVCTLTSLWKEL